MWTKMPYKSPRGSKQGVLLLGCDYFDITHMIIFVIVQFINGY